jgi:hypothetical protein
MLDNMTSMLYIIGMNEKLNVPDEIWLGKKDYSWRADWKVNGWLFVAAIISSASDLLFRRQIAQWSTSAKTIIALVPFVAILLWTRSLARWIRGMDELHRRITVAAVLFATSATFLFSTVWHRLDQAGFFQAIFSAGQHQSANWDIVTVAHLFLLMTFFYFLGYSIFNRRYQ